MRRSLLLVVACIALVSAGCLQFIAPPGPAPLRYRDPDGEYRFHDLDPQGRFVHWDTSHDRIGTWSMPLLRGLVHRHLGGMPHVVVHAHL